MSMYNDYLGIMSKGPKVLTSTVHAMQFTYGLADYALHYYTTKPLHEA